MEACDFINIKFAKWWGSLKIGSNPFAGYLQSLYGSKKWYGMGVVWWEGGLIFPFNKGFLTY